jgi:hypothetical protein
MKKLHLRIKQNLKITQTFNMKIPCKIFLVLSFMHDETDANVRINVVAIVTQPQSLIER